MSEDALPPEDVDAPELVVCLPPLLLPPCVVVEVHSPVSSLCPSSLSEPVTVEVLSVAEVASTATPDEHATKTSANPQKRHVRRLGECIPVLFVFFVLFMLFALFARAVNSYSVGFDAVQMSGVIADSETLGVVGPA